MGDKPDPATMLRQTFAQYQALQLQLAQLRGRLLAIVEMGGMSLAEANEALGIEFFARPASEGSNGD